MALRVAGSESTTPKDLVGEIAANLLCLDVALETWCASNVRAIGDRRLANLPEVDLKELAQVVVVKREDFRKLLNSMVSCVTCRRNVEQLMQENRGASLGFIHVTPDSSLRIESSKPVADVLMLIFALCDYGLLDQFGQLAVYSVPGCRRTVERRKRCPLHSMDMHKARTNSGISALMLDIWYSLEPEVRQRCCILSHDHLLDTTEKYLVRHRFCPECKSKVIQALMVLLFGVATENDKGWCPALYAGLKGYPDEREVHVACDVDFVARLVERAEPEMTSPGSTFERHAKTLDGAQIEVLVCVGMLMWQQLHKAFVASHSTFKSKEIFIRLAILSIKQHAEAALQERQGVCGYLEDLELEEQEKQRQLLRKQQKRQRRKRRKQLLQAAAGTCNDAETMQTMEDARPDNSVCADNVSLSSQADSGIANSDSASPCSVTNDTDTCSLSPPVEPVITEKTAGHRTELSVAPLSLLSSLTPRKKCGQQRVTQCSSVSAVYKCSCRPSFADKEERLLHSMGWSEIAGQLSPSDSEDVSCISEEEIRQFQALNPQVDKERQELRQTLKQRFDAISWTAARK